MIKDISENTTLCDCGTSAKVKNGRIMTEGKSIHGITKVVLTRVNGDVEVLSDWKDNLLTTEGRDRIHLSAYQLASSTQEPFNFIGLSTNSGSPATTDTRTTWELIEKTGSGLGRILFSSRTHNTGDNFTTLVHTFTASAQVLNVQKAGLLDRIATGAGYLAHENTFTLADLENGDQITITWVLTLG